MSHRLPDLSASGGNTNSVRPPIGAPAVTSVAAAGTLGIGVIVLLGWALNIAALKNVLPGFDTMKVNTALCFILAGLALWVLRNDQPGSKRFRLVRGCAALVAIVGGVSLVEDLFGVDCGIDQWLFREVLPPGTLTIPGRMSPVTGGAFILTGLALLLASAPDGRRRGWAQWCALVTGLVGLLAAIGYAYGVVVPYKFGPFSSMAFNTAVTFVVWSCGLLFLHRDSGLMAVIMSERVGGVMARHLLPSAILLLVALGWLDRHSEEVGWFGSQMADAVMVGASVVMFAGLIWVTAVFLNRTDAARQQALAAVQQAEQKYRSIFENAVEGIYQSTPDGTILSANPAMATIHGFDSPAEFIAGIRESGQLDVDSDRRAELKRRLEQDGAVANFESRVRRQDGRLIWVSTTARVVRDAAGEILHYEGTVEEITARKQAEQEREITIEFLRLVNASTGTRDLIQRSITFFQEQSGCAAVGVRLQDGDDYPYYEVRGFPPQFVLAENNLCTRDEAGNVVRDSNGNPVIECMCGNVICGRTSPAKSFFTGHGSFWSNGTTELLASTTDAVRQARTRNRCNGEGYESVALLPLRLGDERLGLLQLNDRRKGVFAAETIALWERLADQLAVALAKFRADEAQQESEQRYQLLAENTDDFVGLNDTQGHRLYISPSYYRVTGWSADPVPSTEWHTRLHPDDLRIIDQARTANLAGQATTIEHRIRCRDGSWIWVEARCKPIFGADGQVQQLMLWSRDITARRQAELALRASENRYRSLFVNMLNGFAYCRMIFEHDRPPDFIYLEVNDAFATLTGLKNVAGKKVSEVVPGIQEADPELLERYGRVARTGVPERFEVYVDALQMWFAIAVYCPAPDHFVAVFDVITERKRTETSLRASLQEKEALLKEVHHRVKNNLQIVTSLLSLQAARTQNQPTLDALRDTQNRVRSMALLHETLYRSGNLAQVNFALYVESLGTHLKRSFGATTSRIELVVQVASLALDLERAIPCGLIITELVSNSFKHAFPGQRSGEILIALHRGGVGGLVLRVADNGVGLPPGPAPQQTSSLGMELVHSLATQLGGTLEHEPGPGTAFRLSFKNSSESA